MYCRKCGFEFSMEGFSPGESIFCPRCGFPNEIPPADTPVEEHAEGTPIKLSGRDNDSSAASAPSSIDVDLDPEEPADAGPFPPPWIPAARSVRSSEVSSTTDGLDIDLTEVQTEISASSAMKVETVGRTCPFCLDTYAQGDSLTICPICHIPHHRECWIENGRKCTTFGCPGQGPGLETRAGEDVEELLRKPLEVDMGQTEPLPQRQPLRNEIRSSLDFAQPAFRFTPPPGGFFLTLALVLVIAFLVLMLIYISGTEPQASVPTVNTEPEEHSSGGAADLNSTEDMVLIEGGTARVGWNSDDALEPKTVDIPAFQIDIHEVTNMEYREFVEETGAAAPLGWAGSSVPRGMENHPVVNVTWEEARAYAEWRGCRLPTEIEFERAARGKGGQTFPWGMNWDSSWTNVSRPGSADPGSFPVMSISGDERDGVYDLAGNVREWTASVYRLPNVPLSGAQRVVRGSSFRLGKDEARGWHRQAELESTRSDDLGFRCARDASR
jgi:formylglycine-generating enzyme required for sulfatase activity